MATVSIFFTRPCPVWNIMIPMNTVMDFEESLAKQLIARGVAEDAKVHAQKAEARKKAKEAKKRAQADALKVTGADALKNAAKPAIEKPEAVVSKAEKQSTTKRATKKEDELPK